MTEIYFRDKRAKEEIQKHPSLGKESKVKIEESENKGRENKPKVYDEENQRLKVENKERKNRFENYDLAEGNEKSMNERLDGEDEGYMIAFKRGIEYDMSSRKREVRMKKEDKEEMEMIRRWHVKINNIYITPLIRMIDPFLQFTIGGDYSINVYKNKKGEIYKVQGGKRGYTDKTEVLEHIDVAQDDGTPGGKTPFSKVIDIEMRMSYSMIQKQKIMIELWDHNFPWMNVINGYITIPLIEIVNGNYNIGEYILSKTEGRKTPVPFAFVEFCCLFQEIWDYTLYFLNWKSTNLLDPKDKISPKTNLPSTKVKVEIIDKQGNALNTVTTSEEVKNSATPLWTKFDNKIVYRGTYSDLENSRAKVTLIDSKGLINHNLCSRIVGLKGLPDFEKIKTEMALNVKDMGDTYPVTVQGFVTIDHKPKYKQSGQNIALDSTKKYLVIKVMRVENIRPAETRGIVDSFISVEWSGMNQRTRTIKENNNPSYNELLYFPVQLKDEWLANISKYILKINEELRARNEVIFNLMIESDNNTYDNFGIGFFYLSEIKGGEKQPDKYFAEDLKGEKKYLCEKYSGKIQLISAFSQSKNTFLHFEAWFLENFPPEVDFGEKKTKAEKRDKIPKELQKYFPQGNDIYFNKIFKNIIIEKFRKYTNYPYQDRMFFNVYPQDQYTNKHLLPYFLSPLTLPQVKYNVKDIETNPNFFDCNMTSLDEIAHFVRCFSYPSELKNTIWSTPDYMTKLRKGNVEEHCLLMASLMLGLKKRNEKIPPFISYEDLDEKNAEITLNNKQTLSKKNGFAKSNLIDTINPGSIVTKEKIIDKTSIPGEGEEEIISPKETSKEEETKEVNIKEFDYDDLTSFPYKYRVYVCQGKLKDTKQPYTWVMTFSEDFRDITFWDPKLDQKFELKGRVKDPKRTKNFLNRLYPSYEAVSLGLAEERKPKKKIIKKEKKKVEEEIKLKGEGDDSIVRYNKEDDFNDNVINDSLYSENANIANIMIDDKIANEITTNKKQIKKGYDFITDDKTIENMMAKSNEKNFLPIDNFFDSFGNLVPDVHLPYDTIDLIFNKNNIYANCQYHNPGQIYYDIYDRTQWLPYFFLEKNIFQGEFESFYPISNFAPLYTPSLIRKMTDSLIKEMRVGIAAARSGKSLPTKFKKKNEKINKLLSKYLDFLEFRSLNRISEQELNKKKKDWDSMCKKYMPKFYRMEAQTVFFNFYELEIIRREITENLEYFWYSKIKNLMFATSARVYAYPNQVVSVRIMLAKFYRIPLEDISDKIEEREYKEMLKEDPDKLVEEEISSDEERDKVQEKMRKKTNAIHQNNLNATTGQGRYSAINATTGQGRYSAINATIGQGRNSAINATVQERNSAINTTAHGLLNNIDTTVQGRKSDRITSAHGLNNASIEMSKKSGINTIDNNRISNTNPTKNNEIDNKDKNKKSILNSSGGNEENVKANKREKSSRSGKGKIAKVSKISTPIII